MGKKNNVANNIGIYSRMHAFDLRGFDGKPKFKKREESRKVQTQKTVLINKENEKIIGRTIRFMPKETKYYHPEERSGMLFLIKQYLWDSPMHRVKVDKIIKEFTMSY